jgi:hypothetical protein
MMLQQQTGWIKPLQRHRDVLAAAVSQKAAAGVGVMQQQQTGWCKWLQKHCIQEQHSRTTCSSNC